MTRKRTIGSLAAAAGLAVSVGWLTAPLARADELSDMQADMQLLQQRMDQLSQFAPGSTGGTAMGAKPVPGASIIGGSFPRSFLIPGTDTSIRVGGTVQWVGDYYLTGGLPNGLQNADVGDNNTAQSMPLNFKSTTFIPGFPTRGGKVAQPTVTSLPFLNGSKGPLNLGGVGGFNTIVENARGNGIFFQSTQQSSLAVETRTPTSFGEARTYLQFDFTGCQADAGAGTCNNLTSVATPSLPRLLYAYGTLGGFLAGQANSNFSDNDAGPETIDQGGDVGQAGVVRLPQVRYTYPGPWGMALSGSLETPETDAITPAGKITSDTTSSFPFSLSTGNAFTNGCVANGHIVGATSTTPGTFTDTSTCLVNSNYLMSKAPDFTISDYWAQPWGHVDFRFVGRDLTINDGHFVDRSLFGYGGGISGTIIPNWFGWTKDNFVAQFNIGDGMGRYLNAFDAVGLETNYANVVPQCVTPTKTCTFAASDVIVNKVPEEGASAGYQHWWLPYLRSNVTFGWSRYDISGALIGPLAAVNTNQRIWTTHVNLIWSPTGFIDAGIEWLWATRMTVGGLSGTEQALISTFIVKF
jgi:hypothetical protein